MVLTPRDVGRLVHREGLDHRGPIRVARVRADVLRLRRERAKLLTVRDTVLIGRPGAARSGSSMLARRLNSRPRRALRPVRERVRRARRIEDHEGPVLRNRPLKAGDGPANRLPLHDRGGSGGWSDRSTCGSAATSARSTSAAPCPVCGGNRGSSRSRPRSGARRHCLAPPAPPPGSDRPCPGRHPEPRAAPCSSANGWVEPHRPSPGAGARRPPARSVEAIGRTWAAVPGRRRPALAPADGRALGDSASRRARAGRPHRLPRPRARGPVSS